MERDPVGCTVLFASCGVFRGHSLPLDGHRAWATGVALVTQTGMALNRPGRVMWGLFGEWLRAVTWAEEAGLVAVA